MALLNSGHGRSWSFAKLLGTKRPSQVSFREPKNRSRLGRRSPGGQQYRHVRHLAVHWRELMGRIYRHDVEITLGEAHAAAAIYFRTDHKGGIVGVGLWVEQCAARAYIDCAVDDVEKLVGMRMEGGVAHRARGA